VVWPPIWNKFKGDGVVSSEIGYLEHIRIRAELQSCLFLTIGHEGAKFMGSMTFDDSAFCLQLCKLLKSKIGLSIKEIGDLDLSHLL